MSQDERMLIQLARRGNTDAFESLVLMHAQLVYNLALRTLNNHQEAEDVAQETFVRAWQALPGFQGAARFSTWLYRITTNLCYNRLPQLKRELRALDVAETAVTTPSSLSPESSLLSQERQQALHDAVTHLPQSYRLLITLRYAQEMSYADIAAVTDMPLGTVKTGLFRAHRLLAEYLSVETARGNE